MKTAIRDDAVIHVFLPRLIATPHAARPSSDSLVQRIYLQQGDLDGACGVCALLMALILRGLLRRRAALSLIRRVRQNYVGEHSVQDLFFEGSSGTDLVKLARSLPQPVRCRLIAGSNSHVLQQVLKYCSRGDPVLLGCESRDGRYSHWVVVVGAEHRGPNLAEPTALLALDPGAGDASPYLRSFNWRLQLDEPRRGARYLRALDGLGRRFLVTCNEAVVVR